MSSNENAIINEHVFIDVAVVFPKLYIIWVTEQAPLFKVVPYNFLILVNMEFGYFWTIITRRRTINVCSQ